MPTIKFGKVRVLLKSGQAKVVNRLPFTIQLLYETSEYVQPLVIGIDPGRTNIGIAVVNQEGKAVYRSKVITRNKYIPKLMLVRQAARKMHRMLARRQVRRRRARHAGTVTPTGIKYRLLPGYETPITCHDIKNKEARFNNRKRKPGWLTPTARHLLLTHLNIIKKVQKILPITDVVMEINKFAFMAMDNPHIKRWEYQNGPLRGYGSVNEAISKMQEGRCLLCGNDIEQYHHIVPRSKGGGNTIQNIAGLCSRCHSKVHQEERYAKRLESKKNGMNKRYHALSVLNQIIPYLVNEIAQLFQDHTYVITGYETKQFRDEHQIEKDHDLDAYCIAASVIELDEINFDTHCYDIRQFRRRDRRICHQENFDRIYLLGGKEVARNRHKSMMQTKDGLEEFAATNPKDIGRLVVKNVNRALRDPDRNMPGSMIKYGNKYFVMKHSTGKHNGIPDYYIATDGTKYYARRCMKTQNNQGLVYCE